jgi:NAD-dependent dihydropyrimidine dehydrogenase PreA subunit
MIFVDQALCDGCGTCLHVCHREAITLKEGIALVDADRCDGCGECVELCPNQALAWITEPILEIGAEPSPLTVIRPMTETIHVETTKPVPWRRTVFPVVGGALSWAGRELVSRLAPLALDALQGALDHRLNQLSRHDQFRPIASEGEYGRGRRRRHRRRRGHPRE